MIDLKVKWKANDIDDILAFLKAINPMQFIKSDIYINVFEIKYKYTTSRDNRKQGIKYLISNSPNPQIDCSKKLHEWIDGYNNKNQHRQLSNVQFLDSRLIASLTI